MAYLKWICIVLTPLLCVAACMVGVPHSYDVSVVNVTCIKPYRDYEYLTCAPLNVFVDTNDLIVVPADFDTDLASIPRALWSFYAPQNTNYIMPSIVHDYLYRCPSERSRLYADDVFYNLLVKNNVSSWTAYKFYVAVRLFGSGSFIENNDCGEE